MIAGRLVVPADARAARRGRDEREGLPCAAKLIWAVAASGDYPAYIGAGLV